MKENRYSYLAFFRFKCISWSRRSFSFDDDVGSLSPRYNPHSPLYSPPYDYEFQSIEDEELPSPEFSPLKANRVGVTISKCNNNYVSTLLD